MKIVLNGENVLNYPSSIIWGGDSKGSARYLQVNDVKAVVGDKVSLFNEFGNELFRGMVYRVDYDSQNLTFNFKAYDDAFRLNKNRLLKTFLKAKPSEIAKNVLAEIGVKAGVFPIDTEICTYTAFDKSVYEIILMAYKLQAAKTKLKYSIVCDLDKISVVEQGTLIEDLKLQSKVNIRSATYSNSIEEMINQVLIYKTEKEKTQIKGKRRDEETIQKYGIFQSVVEEDHYNRDVLVVNDLLKNEEEQGTLEVDGNNDLISGFSVIVFEPNTGLNGRFYIEEDEHIWTPGDYSTRLTLNFENVMQDVEIEKYEKKKPKKLQPKKGIIKSDVGGSYNWQLRN